MSRDDIVTAEAVDSLIADGHTIVIYEDYVLKLDAWLPKHPGGQLAIMHMVGRDGSDEINAYHSLATLKTMKAFRIGRKPPGIWTNRTPPIRGGIFEKHDSNCDSACSNNNNTLAVNAYPSPSPSPAGSTTPLEKTLSQEEKDNIGKLKAAAFIAYAESQDVDRDLKEYPPVDPAIQEDIVKKYRQLHDRVHAEGFYDCPYVEYGKEITRYSILFGTSMFALYHQWYLTSALFLGLFWHQLMFSAHDAAHLAITGNFEIDSLIAMFVADFCCGLSIGWWKSSHNVHHLITNHPEHDPDIQNVPLFATTPTFFKGLHSTYYNFKFAWDAAAELLVPFQHYTYYPVMGIARFNLYLLSWLHVLSSKSSSLGKSKAWWFRPTEIAFMSCYWYIFGYLLLWCTLPTWPIRIGFVLVSHVVTMPLHVQITLSHWGMSTSDLGESESFAQRQLRTTMDVDCPAWLDFIHGGLQFQAVHHLFPRVPRHNLRRLQGLVKEFCESTDIPYTLLGFVDGNAKVIGRLSEVGQQVEHLVNCQKYMAKTGESGLH
ncbi:fatty acid desaturase-domain-containing protein [Podospora australis]|uniref:Delta 8-(E)-sphingolipid desaturase n=1 Tax=Podospora australis TaxID=1536484 RepID=A0AAN6WSN0_9PEZI|nr:fatty acid desaturase-domain-containing protein [Podospora australis]